MWAAFCGLSLQRFLHRGMGAGVRARQLKGSCLDVNIVTHWYIARASQRQTFACY